MGWPQFDPRRLTHVRRGGSSAVTLIAFVAAFATVVLTVIVSGSRDAERQQLTDLQSKLKLSRADVRLQEQSSKESLYGAFLRNQGAVLRTFADQNGSSKTGKAALASALALESLLNEAYAFDRAMNSLENAGGVSSATIKDRADASRRLAALPAAIAANKSLVVSLQRLPDQTIAECERVGMNKDQTKYYLAGMNQSAQLELAAAMHGAIAEFFTEYQLQLRILRDHDGQWTSINGKAYFTDDVPEAVQSKYKEAWARANDLALRVGDLTKQISQADPK